MNIIRQIKEIKAIRQNNFLILDRYSQYLNNCENFITADMVETLVSQCGITEEYAFQQLFMAACGLIPEDDTNDAEIADRYLIPSLHHLSSPIILKDAFCRKIHLPERKTGCWELKPETYTPFELFVCDDIVVDQQLREIPQLGFFTAPVSFPAIFEEGREWMSVKPSEINTMRPAIERVHGNVLAFGLGLGYYPFMISERSEVQHVRIIEQDPTVIRLFEEYVLPQFPQCGKIEVICADAFDYAAKQLPKEKFDFAFVDTWHDAADGVPHYLRMNKLERLSPQTTFIYWVEKTLLSRLRWYYFEKICNGAAPEFSSSADLYSVLNDRNLKSLACELPLEIWLDSME